MKREHVETEVDQLSGREVEEHRQRHGLAELSEADRAALDERAQEARGGDGNRGEGA